MSWLRIFEGTCSVCGDLPILPRQRGQDSAARGDAHPASATNDTWQVRVVANKFAALSPDIKPTRVIHRSRRSMGGSAFRM
jgi:galactose-1-phosphate uridylyltransferase